MPANSTTLYPDKTPMISPFFVANLQAYPKDKQPLGKVA
jgi:hypothetical protein